jgi:hypothetical protein
VHHDAGLEYPVVPLGGVDYFNFDLLNRGIQTNVFFAGVVLAANATHPNVGGTRTNLGARLLRHRGSDGERDVPQRPRASRRRREIAAGRLFLRAGHPFAQFGKIDVSFGVSHQTYQRGEDTAATSCCRASTFTFTPGIELRYARRGWSLAASYDYNRRSEWEPWGNLASSPEQKTFARFGASLGKSFYLPKFQRIGLDFNYIDGQRLDRFSKYELGFFGSQRVHGVQSGSVRAEKAIIGHLSYGFVFSEQFRLEAFYDHALIDDAARRLSPRAVPGTRHRRPDHRPLRHAVRLDIGK